jgi:integrase
VEETTGMAKKRGNNEGSIYRRKNGTWAAQYTLWTAEGRKRRSMSGKTRAEVSRKLTEAMADRDGGLLYDAGKLTIGEYLNLWLADSVKGTVNETTYANYAYITHKHISPALGHVKLKTLTPAHVRGFYGDKARTKLSAATVKKMHVVLRKALSQAVSDGLIPRNAADGVKPPRVSAPGEEIKTLSSEECATFLVASCGERLEALYVLATHCGLCEGELLALRWEDVCLEDAKPAVLVRRTLTRGEDGRGWVVGASTPSLARVGVCVLPGKQPLPSKITANASSRSGCAWPGSGRTRASSSPTRPVIFSTPQTCVTAPSSVSKLEPASETTYASTISGTRAPRCC